MDGLLGRRLVLAILRGVIAVVDGLVDELVALLREHVEGVTHQDLLLHPQLILFFCLWVLFQRSPHQVATSCSSYHGTARISSLSPHRACGMARLLAVVVVASWALHRVADSLHRPEADVVRVTLPVAIVPCQVEVLCLNLVLERVSDDLLLIINSASWLRAPELSIDVQG